jgi:hypothetical protein
MRLTTHRRNCAGALGTGTSTMAHRHPLPVRSFQRLSMASLLLFAALQCADALTTLLFLRHGVAEANPLIRAAFGVASPAVALLAVKSAGCGLAYLAWRGRRVRILRRVNCFFGVCLAWNLLAISLGPAA